MNITYFEAAKVESVEVIGKSLTGCHVDKSGELFRLGFACADGSQASVVLPVDCLRSLLMTLPNVIERALRARYGDHTLKVVYPIGGWSLHSAEGSEDLILTVTTPDDFKVSFSLTQADASKLATSLGQVDPETGPKPSYN
jgi:hypothetical protein